jgi:RNA polymerase sigma-70 factor (ECF subfamily)
VQQLTSAQQHVLALRFSQGLSIEETARLMHKTIGAVKVLQFRALEAVRKLLHVGEKER